MKKKVLLMLFCSIMIGVCACGENTANDSETESQTAAGDETNDESEDVAEEEALTEDRVLEAVKNYCLINNPDLEEESDEYTVYWDVTTNEDGEIVVLYRSYTGAETRYYVDALTGETYATELVPGIIDEEEKTEENFNIKDYME